MPELDAKKVKAAYDQAWVLHLEVLAAKKKLNEDGVVVAANVATAKAAFEAALLVIQSEAKTKTEQAQMVLRKAQQDGSDVIAVGTNALTKVQAAFDAYNDGLEKQYGERAIWGRISTGGSRTRV